MALPRSKYVQEGQEGVYHCFSRCVRRAFLYGVDTLTGRDFSHRKAWLVDNLHQLAAVFAIEVCAFSIMANHYHTILRTRPDIVAKWSDLEVAARWLTLFPRRSGPRGKIMSSIEEQIHALAQCPERIARLRKRMKLKTSAPARFLTLFLIFFSLRTVLLMGQAFHPLGYVPSPQNPIDVESCR
jgi:hypothetical protein